MAKAGISVCLTDSDSQKPMSQVINGTLEFSDEIVRIKYPKFESSGKNVEILFLCDETAEIGTPRIISDEKSTKVEIEWWTSAACPPIPVQCSFLESNNHFYDFSALRKMNGESYTAYDLSYMKENGGDEKQQNREVEVNFCAEIFPGEFSGCPFGSAVCEPSKKLSYGSALTLEFSHNSSQASIQAKYSDGSECAEKPGERWRSIFETGYYYKNNK